MMDCDSRAVPIPVILSFVTTELVPGIVADPAIAFGKPIIQGTRIPAALVLAQLAAGIPEAELRSEYELTADQVRAALRYAAWLADQEVVRLRAS